MALNTFQKNDKYGVKNNAGTIIHEAIFDEIHLCRNGFFTPVYIDKKEYTRIWKRYDLCGDFIDNIQQNDIIELFKLSDEYFIFSFSHYSSMELFGILDFNGDVRIPPIFDEFELIDNRFFCVYYGDHDGNYKSEVDDYDPEYGSNLYNLGGGVIFESGIRDVHGFTDDGKYYLFESNYNVFYSLDKWNKLTEISEAEYERLIES